MPDDIASLPIHLRRAETRALSSHQSEPADPKLRQPSNEDAEILALFDRWLQQSGVIDELVASDPRGVDDRVDEAYERRAKIKEQIFACRGGPLGLAVKAFLVVKSLSHGITPLTSQVRVVDCDDSTCEMFDWAESVLRDAAVLVPRIGECAAAVLHEDAALISAGIEIDWATEMLAEQTMPDEHRQWVRDQMREALDTVANTTAKTARGEAIRSRYSAAVAGA